MLVLLQRYEYDDYALGTFVYEVMLTKLPITHVRLQRQASEGDLDRGRGNGNLAGAGRIWQS